MVDTTWSPELAYSVGLLAADGCLATGQSLIDLTSRDLEQVRNYKKCLKLNVKIGIKSSGNGNKAYRIQFKSALFYKWLQEIGFTPNKSKTLGPLKVPRDYFFDFLRGLFDGDGSNYSYFDPRWRSSFMFYLSFTSASPQFILWLQSEINKQINVKGHVTTTVRGSGYQQLRFAKTEALKIIKKMYYSPAAVCLLRKKNKIDRAMQRNIENNQREW